MHLEINVTGAGKEALDSSCYRLKQPATGDDIPWLRTAALTLRKGTQPVLEVRSNQILHDPILALSIHVACGQEISRDFVLLASPAREPGGGKVGEEALSASVLASASVSASPADKSMDLPRRSKSRSRVQDSEATMTRVSSVEPPVKSSLSPKKGLSSQVGSTDRLTLLSAAEVGEPVLQYAAELTSLNQRVKELNETQREMLRLEFRMLQALQEQALTQLEATEKLRNMDQALQDLQKKVAEPTPKEIAPAPVVNQVPVAVQPVPVIPQSEDSFLEEWGLYLALLLMSLGCGGWLVWKGMENRRNASEEIAEYVSLEPLEDENREIVQPADFTSVPELPEEVPAVEPIVQVDLHLDDTAPTALDLSLCEGLEGEQEPLVVEEEVQEEGFDANPVMELADIMLSFGRVKGAAQALQEYIDTNPQEALQPWVRLLEVYRMAGMRQEFESLALNLNKNFNVEIPHWDKPAEVVGGDQQIDFVLEELSVETPVAPKAERLEDMPRIMQQIIEHWTQPDFSAFVYQLLRDNRGGARLGFSLGVVGEMLFLIELKETVLRMERES